MGVATDKGEIEAEVVVNAGGIFAQELGALAGVNVPIVPMAHEYLVTRPAGLPLDMPTMRDPSLLVYFRPESGGLVMGGYERDPAPWALDGIAPDFNSRLLEEDWPRFEPLARERGAPRPGLEEMEVVRLINGPEAFTPDGEFILGPTDVRGFWVAAGFCAHGLAGAGGNGEAGRGVDRRGDAEPRRVADGFAPLRRGIPDSCVHGRPHDRGLLDVLRRQVPGARARGGAALRLSPAYPRLQELGASFGEKSGWERANWFEPNAAAGDESLRPRGWAGRHWSPAIGAEHRACREAAALFDESSFAKIEVSGEGAAELLEWLCDNHVARDVGAITYTQMLNARGGIECDFTVTRLAAERFRIVTGTAFGRHDLAWIRQHAPDDGSVTVTDVTSAYACLGLWGPKAREILGAADDGSLDFPYMRRAGAGGGGRPVPRARSRTSASSAGSSTARRSSGSGLWDTGSGRPAPSTAASRAATEAIDSLGLEKGYRVWARTSPADDTPYEAGLGFAGQARQGLPRARRLCSRGGAGAAARVLCALRPTRVALGSEPGRVRRRARRPRHERRLRLHRRRSIAYAYLPEASVEPGTPVEVEIFGEWVGGEVAAEPLYDPSGERLRA
jgi:4-methylaminobutanoate oxidase (formaldehyde-forming)